MAVIVLVAQSALADQALDESRRWAPPTLSETLLLTGSEAMIAIDVLQTLDLKRHRGMAQEINPLLGAHPSDARLMASAVGGGLLLAVVWYALPPKIRWIAPCIVSIGESLSIANNAAAGMTIRF